MYCFHRASHVPVPSLLDLVYETYWFVPTVLLITLLPEVVDKARTILAPKSTGLALCACISKLVTRLET